MIFRRVRELESEVRDVRARQRELENLLWQLADATGYSLVREPAREERMRLEKRP